MWGLLVGAPKGELSLPFVAAVVCVYTGLSALSGCSLKVPTKLHLFSLASGVPPVRASLACRLADYDNEF